MYKYLVIEIKEKAEIKLDIVLENYYYLSLKERLESEGKKTKVISCFEYYI